MRAGLEGRGWEVEIGERQGGRACKQKGYKRAGLEGRGREVEVGERQGGRACKKEDR